MASYTAAYTDIRINDNSRFRTQGQWISDQFTTMGWTKTADTGQIDWSTVTAPGAADTSQGYEIRSNGTLYMRVQYGSGLAAYAKALWFQFGPGSDGAGAITNPYTGAIQLRTATGYSGASARAGDDYMSGDSTRFMVALTDDTNATYGGALILQPSLDADGDDDGLGWYCARAHYQNIGGVVNVRDRDQSSRYELGIVRWPRAVGDASNIPISPVLAAHPLRNLTYLRDCYVGPTSLCAHQSTVTIDGKTFLAAYGNTNNLGVWGFTPVANLSFLVRYD